MLSDFKSYQSLHQVASKKVCSKHVIECGSTSFPVLKDRWIDTPTVHYLYKRIEMKLFSFSDLVFGGLALRKSALGCLDLGK